MTTQETSGQESLAQADEAMYIAKRMGCNQIRTVDDARQVGEDVEPVTRLQQKEQLEVIHREGFTLEQLRENSTQQMICSLLVLLTQCDEGLSANACTTSDLATTIAPRS